MMLSIFFSETTFSLSFNESNSKNVHYRTQFNLHSQIRKTLCFQLICSNFARADKESNIKHCMAIKRDSTGKRIPLKCEETLV